MVAGDAVNTAARVQAAAEPGAVLVDEGTRRVAEAAVAFHSAGEHALKGKAEPMSLWRAERVLSGVGGSQRIDGLEAGFVGRDAELRLVKELFHACVERRTSRLVSVTGAAGVGKSRLGWEFEKYVDGLADTVWWHRGRCLSYGDGVAFWALAEMVRQRFDIADEDPTSVAGEKLSTGLQQSITDGYEQAYIGPRLAQLLGTEAATEVQPQLGREELFAGWRLFFERLAAQAPVVMVVEDLQHADAGLLDFLEHLLDWAKGVPIFVLTLARPELESRRAGWGSGRRNSTALTLDPLDDAAMGVLLDGLVPGMPDTAKTVVAGRAEGIPLYAVETIRMLIDRDIVQPIDGLYRLTGDVGELSVPATLQSLLAARLDALGPDERSLVADAAVLGSTFPAEALVAVSPQPETDVRRRLDELVRREVLGVRADPLSPQRGQYGFVQTMFRQVAYDTLSRRERKARHLAVAAHLRQTFADEGEEVAEVIAAHLMDALTAVPDDPDVPELRAEAVSMLTRAGERAERTGAPTTAATAYTTAAGLLEETGGAANELAAAALWERAGKAARSTDLSAAVEHYQQAAHTYRKHARSRDAARAMTGVGHVMGRQGRLNEARTTLQQALTGLEADLGADTVVALSQLAVVEAFSGDSPAADRLSAAALSHAQALGLSDARLSDLLMRRGLVHIFANRPVQAVASYREALRRAEASQDSAAAARALFNLADALVSSEPIAAVDAARTAMVHFRRIGHRQSIADATSNLMQALLMTGDWDGADHAYMETVKDDDELRRHPMLAQSTVLLRALRGDSQGDREGLHLIAQLDGTDDPQDLAGMATARAAASAAEFDFEESLSHAQLAVGHADVLGFGADSTRWSWPLAADAALALGDLREASQLVDLLDQQPRGHIPPVLRAESQRIRARLLAAQADPSAADAFDAATQGFRQLGSPYHLAVGLLDQAEYLTATDDPQTAQQLAAEAEGIAERLGAQPLLKRVRRLLPGAAHEQLNPAALAR
jgi:tetratricopeptide (TPR) repeat protein